MLPRTVYMYTHKHTHARTHTHRWIQWIVLGLCCTTMVGAVDFGPEDPNWQSAVETASPGTTISLRPGVYVACNVAIPSGVKHSIPKPN
jgi:hypothetical protein